MRHSLSILLCCLLVFSLFVPAGFSETGQLHLLWDMPFNCSAGDVMTFVKLNKGISCSRTSHAPTALTPSYESIDSANDSDLFLYGYSFHFSYSEYPSVFTLTFQIGGDIDDFQQAAGVILSGLLEKYGTPDASYLESGLSADTGRRSIYSIDAGALLPFDHVSNAIANGTVTDKAAVYVRFYNIIMLNSFNSDLPSTITIQFNSEPRDLFGMPGADTF